jgi:hypothetical protein
MQALSHKSLDNGRPPAVTPEGRGQAEAPTSGHFRRVELGGLEPATSWVRSSSRRHRAASSSRLILALPRRFCRGCVRHAAPLSDEDVPVELPRAVSWPSGCRGSSAQPGHASRSSGGPGDGYRLTFRAHWSAERRSSASCSCERLPGSSLDDERQTGSSVPRPFVVPADSSREPPGCRGSRCAHRVIARSPVKAWEARSPRAGPARRGRQAGSQDQYTRNSDARTSLGRVEAVLTGEPR